LEKPDLIIVDGGKGQINIAQEVIDSLCMNIMIVGLKKDDKHSTNALIKDNEEIPINKESNLFYYLERMQDEVHNFTINYHKQIRSKGAISSILDNISGIGEKRKKELIKKYKNITNIKEADIEELDKLLPHEVSINLKQFLENMDN
jgi:excinuclease ABC subunit C